MSQGTNPFDEPYDIGLRDTFGSDNPAAHFGIATNPFNEEESPNYSNPNPFDDPFPNADDEREDVGISLSTGVGAPAEASWQYLGDLPYRRVPIYSNVRWYRSSNEEEDDSSQLYQSGLAAFPPSVLKQHPKMLDPREIRALLNTSTITKVAGCPHGGVVAAITLPLVGDSGGFNHAELRIMTNAGRPLAKLDFPPRGLDRRYSPSDVLSIGFTDRTSLIVVLRDSLCLTFDLVGDRVLQPFHILPRGDGKGMELLQASVYDSGVAVLSVSKHAAIVELMDDHDDPDYFSGAHISARRIIPSSTAMTDAFGAGKDVIPANYAIVTHLPTADHASNHFLSYLAIAVLSRHRTSSRHPEVFISTTDNSVIVVNVATCEVTDVECRARIASPIVDMSFAPNGRFLACFTQTCMLTVISTSFETKVLDFDTSEGSSSPPLDMKWCGEDSVVLHWKNLGVLMVGPYGDWLRFPYEGTENVHLIPEIDCCRVITDSSVEILQRVPPATALLLRIGSIEPSAMLLDASDAFESGSPASEEAARAIIKTGALQEAIETCTDAATKEFDIVTQKRLLRAASYGMHFSYKDADEISNIMGGEVQESDEQLGGVRPSPTTVKFVAAARKLRIMNALRNPNVGFILTTSQFDAITATGVIARLVAMRRPALATSISAYLNLPKSVQLFARASKAAALVASDKGRSDAETAEAAIQLINEDDKREGPKPSNSSINRGCYATVAMAANKAGRPGVANLLLILESSVSDKVPALISTGSFADAMAVATFARDAEFIFTVLMEYERICMGSSSDASKAHATFLGTVVSKFTTEGFNTLRYYLGTMADVKDVVNLLLRAQKFTDAGAEMAIKGVESNEIRERQAMLSEASRIFGLGKETAFHKSCTDDYLELLKDQEVLRTKYGTYEVAPESSSVTATVSSVIHHAAVNKREQHRLLADADKIAKKFRIPEKRLWHIKVKAFSDSEQWSNLRILADMKKPPIGYKPFALAAIRGKQNANEILRYIEKVSVFEEKYDLYCEAGLWKLALEEAAKRKDMQRMMNVKTLCNSPEIQQLVDQTMTRIA